jgi:hypothetical protein
MAELKSTKFPLAFFSRWRETPEFVLEVIYLVHKLIVFLICGFVVVVEGIIGARISWKMLRKGLKKEVSQLKKKLVYSVLWTTVFILFGIANLYVFEEIVGPKLTDLKIISPKEMSTIPSGTTEVSISARNVKPPVYVIVGTPQGALWVQDKVFPTKFKENLVGRARLGQGEVGIGDIFRIFAVATKDNLQIGPLVTIPPDSIHSNTVSVRRIR